MAREQCPKKLYKYHSLEEEKHWKRFESLVNGKIYCAHPKKFNDPFDTWSLLHSESSKEYEFADNLKHIHKELASRNLPQAIVESIFSSHDWVEELNDAYKVEGLVNGETIDEMRSIDIVMNEEACKKRENALEKQNLEIRDAVRIACFSTNDKSLSMWYHYANMHKGVCLEYDTSELFSQYEKLPLLPVIYVNKLPDIEKHRIKQWKPDFGSLNWGIKLRMTGWIYSQCCHKLDEWNYEQEWRYIDCWFQRWQEWNQVPEEWRNREGILLDFVKPSKILVGTKVSDKNESKICTLIDRHKTKVVNMKVTPYGLKPIGS